MRAGAPSAIEPDDPAGDGSGLVRAEKQRGGGVIDSRQRSSAASAIRSFATAKVSGSEAVRADICVIVNDGEMALKRTPLAPHWQAPLRTSTLIALCRAGSDVEEAAARRYFGKAGYEVLPGSLQEKSGYRESLNRGEGLTECKHKALAERAAEVISGLLELVREEVHERKTKQATVKSRARVR